MKKTSTLFFMLLLFTTMLSANSAKNVQKELCAKLRGTTNLTDYSAEINVLLHQFLQSSHAKLKSTATVVQRLDSLYADSWNSSTSTWENMAKTEYTYNEMMQNTVQLSSDWDMEASAWINTTRDEVFYDATGYVSSFISSEWDAQTNNWVYAFKAEFVYNETGVGEMLAYIWNAETSEWDLLSKLTITVNASGDPILMLTSVFDAGSGTWFDVWKSEFTYDGDGNLSMTIDSEFSFTTFSWVFSIKYVYAYNANNYESEEIRYTWDETTSAWLNSYKHELAYDDSGNQDVLNVFNWNGSQWVYSIMQDYTYNMAYPISEIVVPALNGPDWQFNYMPVSITYSNQPLPVRSMNTGRDMYYYSEQNATSVIQNNAIVSQVMPNPAVDRITVRLADGKQAKLEIYNLSGRVVLSNEVIDNQSIVIDQLASGTYFYRIISANEMTTGKLVVQ
jgi:hypothetical protein